MRVRCAAMAVTFLGSTLAVGSVVVRRARPALGLTTTAAAPAATAAPGTLPRRRTTPLRVFVMTMGPGDHPFFRFGHDAIWLRRPPARTDRVYNFGTFRFDSPRLILDFLGGRLNYWLSVSSLAPVIAGYGHENRSIDVQELA